MGRGTSSWSRTLWKLVRASELYVPRNASVSDLPYTFKSENILAIGAPSTTKCDLCQVSFCGINVPGRCVAASLSTQYPHGMLEIEDLIQSQDVYECFEQNAYEVEVLLDYLKSQRLTPTHIYREVRFPPITWTDV
jgi:hypothetical protein